jgi:hypothetical protein
LNARISRAAPRSSLEIYMVRPDGIGLRKVTGAPGASRAVTGLGNAAALYIPTLVAQRLISGLVLRRDVATVVIAASAITATP